VLFLASVLWLVGPVRAAGVWLDVPFVRQEENGCVAASISMVMQYWNKNEEGELASHANHHTILKALSSQEAPGIFVSSMERYLQDAGFRTIVFPGNWMEVEHHLERGRPLIVCLGEGGANRHCMVVTGLDLQSNFVLVNDPARRKLLRMDRTDFEKDWNVTGRWTLLAVPETGE
jgi:uncharacterized protein YvpB